MQSSNQNNNWYLSSFDAFEKSLNGEAQSKLHSVRKSAISRFAELGFPTTKHEEWKYTDVSPISKMQFKSVIANSTHEISKKEIEKFLPGSTKQHVLVFVNGHFSKELSSVSAKSNIKFESLAAALKNDTELALSHITKHASFQDNAFVALNTSFLKDGAFVHVPKGTIVEEPIHLLFIANGLDSEFVSYPRNLIVVGENSQVTIIEHYVSLTSTQYFTNVVSEIVVGENAIVHHEKIQLESERAYHVNMMYLHQARASNFVSNNMSFGGALVRNNINAVLDGEGAECTLNGLYFGTGTQLIDNHTAIDHAKPHCSSHELYKGILDGKSKGVFNGKIIVRKDAQKTDAKQTNKNLVLSDDATIDTKPQLEIFANDVKCTHGATIGQLDDEALFYLKTRGIGTDEARDMLIDAFANDVVERISVPSLRENLFTILRERRMASLKKRETA